MHPDLLSLLLLHSFVGVIFAQAATRENVLDGAGPGKIALDLLKAAFWLPVLCGMFARAFASAVAESVRGAR